MMTLRYVNAPHLWELCCRPRNGPCWLVQLPGSKAQPVSPILSAGVSNDVFLTFRVETRLYKN